MSDQTPSQNRTILIIEDDTFLRQLVSDKLRNEGYTVVQTITGEDGLAKLAEMRPDLILLDLILPEMDGFAVLAKIQADETLRTIPTIILSNLGQKNDIESGIHKGAREYLIKAHVSPREIAQKVRKILGDAS